MRMMKQAFFYTVIVMSFVLVISSCSTALSPPTSITPTMVATPEPFPTALSTDTPTSTPFRGSTAQLGPLPLHCPSSPNPQTISPDFGSMAGIYPLWVGVFQHGPLTIEWSPNDVVINHDQYGWEHKFLYIVATRYQGTITIHGTNLSDHSPVYLRAQDAVTTGESTTLVLDTRSPNIANRNNQWTQFPGGLAVPKAGCYRLEAQWQEENWSITFAAGEVSATS